MEKYMSFNSLSELKSNSAKHFESLLDSMEEKSKKYDNEDTSHIWKPTQDEAGNGEAIIRFLPSPPGEDTDYVKLYSHSFKGPTGRWYIENSLSTLNQPDPLGDLNRKLWATEIKANQELVRQRKRKTDFFSNIYVISDPAKPENNGKVFLYKYGVTILKLLQQAAKPQFSDEKALNPFNLWTGANFHMRFYNRERDKPQTRSYDKSYFAAPSQLMETDDEMEVIWKQCHSLQEIISPKNFKSYDQLKKHLDDVLGNGAKVGTAESISSITGDPADDNFVMESSQETVIAPPADLKDDQDKFDYFAGLASDD